MKKSEYEKFCLSFKKKSIFFYVAPSLLSKSLEFENDVYWQLSLDLKFSEYFPNPLKILSLFLCFLRIILYYIKQSFLKKDIVCLLSRSGGIRNNYSCEDYRFLGLEKELVKKNHGIVYYVQGIPKKRKNFFYKYPVIYSEDVYSLAKFIFLITFPLTIFFPEITLFQYPRWKFDIYINTYSSIICYFFSLFFKKTFFWDFNYYHYPLFIGSFFSNCKLVGSMHNFNVMKKLPWISDKNIFHLKVKYSFNNYENTFKIMKKTNLQCKFPLPFHLNFKKDKFNIVIIQENQTDQVSLIEYIKKNLKSINKIYVKLRPDKVKSDVFIYQLKEKEIKYKLIEDIYSDETKDFVFMGTQSTLLLDLASQGRLSLSFSENNYKYFDYPVFPFVKIKNNFKREPDSIYKSNPIYLSSKKKLNQILKRKTCIYPSNPLKNHIIYNHFKIKSIISLIIS